MNIYLKPPYFSVKAHDLDRAEFVLTTGEFKDGRMDDDSMIFLRCDTEEERDAIHYLVAGEKVDTPLGPVDCVETQDDCPIVGNVIESLGVIRLYELLDQKLSKEFEKSVAHSDATIDVTEVLRLRKIQDGLVEAYPTAKWLRTLNNKAMKESIAEQRQQHRDYSENNSDPSEGGKKGGRSHE